MTNDLALLPVADPLPGTAYPKFVHDLMKPGAKLLEGVSADKLEFNHLVCGFSGELGELAEIIGTENNEAALIEELGDFQFYCEDLRHRLAVHGDPFEFEYPAYQKPDSKRPIERIMRGLTIDIGNLVDTIKRYTIYGKPLDLTKARREAICVMNDVREIQYVHGFTDEAIQWANKEKLRQRYEDLVYSDKAAIGRADKAQAADPVAAEPAAA